MIKGIDISEHQKSIDFQRVKAAGIQFVIPREGLRKRIDDYFLEYIRKAKEAGIAILGVYHFIYTDEATIKENAQSTIANMKAAGLDLGPCRHPLTTLPEDRYDCFLEDLKALDFDLYKCKA